MERAWKRTGAVRVPVLYLYGNHDQVIPKRPSYQAAARLKPGDRTAFYADGWHLLIRDKQRQNVISDVAAFIRDDHAPLPSGAPPIPRPGGRKTSVAPQGGGKP
jgi:alpha-beta hydrolase superfamily lysophospholipase